MKVLFDYLTNGQSVDAFVRPYPSVSRAHAVPALEEAEELLEVTG